MQIDPSIPLSARGVGPIKSPLDVYQEAERFKMARESSLALAEQRRSQAANREEQTAKIAKENADRLAGGAALKAGGGMRDQTLAYLTANNPDLLPTMTKVFDEQDERAAKVLKLRQELHHEETGMFARQMQYVADNGYSPAAAALQMHYLAEKFPEYADHAKQLTEQLAQADEPTRKQLVDSVIQMGMTTEQRLTAAKPIAAPPPGQSLLDPKTLKPVVTTPAAPAQNFDAAILSAQRAGDQAAVQRLIALKGQAEAAGRVPKDERLVQVMKNGIVTWVRESQAEGQPAAQAARAVTGQERNVLAFFNRAEQAANIVTPLEDRISKMGLIGQAGLQTLPNFLQPEQNQSYRQAQRAFTEARLRKESGAAIPPAEYENDSKTYFAQPGDTAATLEQKRKARQTVLDGLAFSSGKAYEEYYGEPFKKPGGSATPGAPVDLVFDPASGTFKKPGGGS